MLFKYLLQILTCANFPPSFPNNKLREELQLIEQIKNEISIEDNIDWRKLTIDAYLAIYRAKNALIDAKKGYDSKGEWLRAYDKAQKADTAMHEFLKYKLHISLQYSYIHIQSVAFLIAGLLNYFKPNSFDKPVNELTKTQLIIVACCFFLLTSFLYTPELVFYKRKANLETNLIRHHWCNKVLAEARKYGIEINTNPNVVPRDQRWSNWQLLNDINCEKTPEKFNCLISYNVMDRPVYCSQHKARFEESFINEWLYQKNTHPLTREQIFSDELIQDTELEDEIAMFTHNAIKKFINHETMKPTLEQIEMKSEDEFSMQANQQWRI